MQPGFAFHNADNIGDDRLIIHRSGIYPDSPSIARTGPVQDVDRFNIPVSMAGADLQIGTFPGKKMQFDQGIFGDRGVTIAGLGEVEFRRATDYLGPTVVASGTLTLVPSGGLLGLRSGGTLTIGDGVEDGPAFVDNRSPMILGAVNVRPDGPFHTHAFSRIVDLRIVDSFMAMVGDGVLSYKDLYLENGFIETHDNAGIVALHEGHTLVRQGGSISRANGTGTMSLEGERHRVDVDPGATLTIRNLPVTGGGLRKLGPGKLVFSGTGLNTFHTTVVEAGELSLERAGATGVGPMLIGGTFEALVSQRAAGSIQASSVNIDPNGALRVAFPTTIPERIDIRQGRLIVSGSLTSLSTPALRMDGGTVSIEAGQLKLAGQVARPGELHASALDGQPAVIEAAAGSTGHVFFSGVVNVHTEATGQPIALRIDAPIVGDASSLFVKWKAGVALLTKANSFTGHTNVRAGSLLVTVSLPGPVTTAGSSVLGGTGTVGVITNETADDGSSGTIAPGLSPGRLTTIGLLLQGATRLAFEVHGLTPGTEHDQLDVRGPVELGATATLALTTPPAYVPPASARFTLIANDGVDPVLGTFAGLAEGAEVRLGGRDFTLTYRGGDGNDIVLAPRPRTPDDPTPTPGPTTHFLSEGATGDFFDTDILIANPNAQTAPVTLTFSTEAGAQVVTTRTLPPLSRLTVRVDEIQGLEATSASAQITSDARLPLIVERSMFWNDELAYAGSTGSAVEQPEPDWFFAEGSQGFFDTYVLVINPNPSPTDVTFTFFLENAPTVVKTLTVGAATRLTLHAGELPELIDRSFGIAVHATQPIMAERSMYFGTTPTRRWSGGTESAGVTAPSTRWFLAEGATGSFFDTFILLSNPQTTPAAVTLQYLLNTGETITVDKTIPAGARLTTNIETEDDVRLHGASVSTVVTADVPIIAERSMYWRGAGDIWVEAHNSFGVVEAGTRWGLAEGRIRGPRQYQTYILLANPQPTAASVRVTYLRETGAPLVETYTVPPTSRFNIETHLIAGLADTGFGAIIEVTNDVPIVVERSMYWASSGLNLSGGTNATGIRLAPVPTGAGISAGTGHQP